MQYGLLSLEQFFESKKRSLLQTATLDENGNGKMATVLILVSATQKSMGRFFDLKMLS